MRRLADLRPPHLQPFMNFLAELRLSLELGFEELTELKLEDDLHFLQMEDHIFLQCRTTTTR